MPDRNYPVTGQYDLVLESTGQGWNGTYAGVIRKAVEDITDDGPFGPVEVTYDDGRVITGVLQGFGAGDDVIVIAGLALEVERIEGFRA